MLPDCLCSLLLLHAVLFSAGPQKYYCPGGAATVAYNTNTPTVVTGTTMVQCPKQLWTEGLGAVDEQSCCKCHTQCAGSHCAHHTGNNSPHVAGSAARSYRIGSFFLTEATVITVLTSFTDACV